MIIISFWATFNILFRLLRLQYIKEDPFGPSVTAIEVNYSNLDRTAPCRVVVAFFAPVQPTHTSSFSFPAGSITGLIASICCSSRDTTPAFILANTSA